MSEENILKVKSILGPQIIIAGMENYENDKIYCVLNEKLFNYILHGHLNIDTTYLFEVIAIKKIWNIILRKMDEILSELRRDIYIKGDQYYLKYINVLEHAIITGLFLQKLENILYTKNQIRQILLENEALAYVSLYRYLKVYINGAIRTPTQENKEKEMEDIKTILRIYKAINKYNIGKLKRLGALTKDLIMALVDPNYADVTKELETIKRYTIIYKKAKLKRKISQLNNRKKEIDEKIEILKSIDPSNPEIQELEKEKKEIEELLNKLIKRKKIIKENIQNEQEKAKEESKEIENKNGQ